MTLAGRAKPVVLASYDGEPQGEHARLNEQQATGFCRVVCHSPISDQYLGLAAKVLPNFGALILGTDAPQRISVRYPDSLLNENQLSGFAHAHVVRASGPRSRDQALDAVVGSDGHATTPAPYIDASIRPGPRSIERRRADRAHRFWSRLSSLRLSMPRSVNSNVTRSSVP